MRTTSIPFTYITKNSIAATIASANEAVDFVNALSTAAGLCCTVIDVDLAHLSCEPRQALARVAVRFDPIVDQTGGVVGTRRLTLTWIDGFGTRETGVPRRTEADESIETVDARRIGHARIRCAFVDLDFALNTRVGRRGTNAAVPVHSVLAQSINTRRTRTVVDQHVTIGSCEARQALAGVIPYLVDARAVVQAGSRSTFVRFVLAIQTQIIIETSATVSIHQRHTETVVQTWTARTVVDHRCTCCALETGAQISEDEDVSPLTLYP